MNAGSIQGSKESQPLRSIPPISEPREVKAAKTVNQVASAELKILNENENKRPNIISARSEGLSEQIVLNVGIEPETVDDLVAGMIREAALEDVRVTAELQEEFRKIARFILENAPLNAEEDIYLRPRETKLKVPITFAKGGRVVVHLKSKLGKLFGSGTFKVTKQAIAMIRASGSNSPSAIEQAASATMSPKETETDRMAADNEIKMQIRIRDLGSNPHVVGCHTATKYEHKKLGAPQKICIVMEVCSGGDALGLIKWNLTRELLDLEPGLSDEEVHSIIEDYLTGIDFLHDHNIFFSDIKLSNVMLTREGRAKVGDFGCGRDLNDPTQRTYLMGDQPYQAPEVKEMMEKFKRAPVMRDLKEDQFALNEAKKQLDEAEIQYNMAKEVTPELEANLRNAKQHHHAALLHYKLKKEALIAKFRTENLVIDPSILKADVYGLGMVLEGIYLGKCPELEKEFQKEYQNELRPLSFQLLSLQGQLKQAQSDNNEAVIAHLEERTAAIRMRLSDLQKKYVRLEEMIAEKEKLLSLEMKDLISRMKEIDPSKRLSVKEALATFRRLRENKQIFSPERVEIKRGASQIPANKHAKSIVSDYYLESDSSDDMAIDLGYE